MTKEDKRFFVKLFVEAICKTEIWARENENIICYELPGEDNQTNSFQTAVDVWMKFLEED